MTSGKKKGMSIGVLIIAAIITYVTGGDVGALLSGFGNGDPASQTQRSNPASTSVDDHQFDQLFADRRSDVIVTGSARIKRVLRDDNDGSRHQRLLVDVPSGLTVLIAHNIDLAPRVADPQVGSEIRFQGEYEWTEKGGVLHWTHHDPAGRHPGGWLEYRGKRYE